MMEREGTAELTAFRQVLNRFVRSHGVAMDASERRQWRRLIAALRKAYPIDGKISVYHRRLSGNLATVTTDHNHHRIAVDSRSTLALQIDGLIHEWAHILDRHDSQATCEIASHSDSWGIWYARCYRVWVEVNSEGV